MVQSGITHVNGFHMRVTITAARDATKDATLPAQHFRIRPFASEDLYTAMEQACPNSPKDAIEISDLG
jgi:hypothetical protein